MARAHAQVMKHAVVWWEEKRHDHSKCPSRTQPTGRKKEEPLKTPYSRKGFTLVEVMIVVAIIALLAAIAIPNVLRGRTTANEAAAVGNARAVMSALEMYRAVNNQYPAAAAWVAEMYTTPDPDFGPPSFNVAMTGQTVQGYNWTYTRPTTQTYTISAVAQTLGSTGTRAFFASEAGTVRHCRGAGPADAADLTLDQPPVAC